MACGDSDSTPDDLGAGTGGAGDGAGGSEPAIAEECDGPNFEPDFVFDLFDGAGEGAFYGTIEFPEELEAGSLMLFFFDVDLGGFFGASAYQLPRMMAETSKSITYGVEGLPVEEYWMAMWVPKLDDAPPGTPIMEGDWYGFYGGTVEEPMQYRGGKEIRIGSSTVCGMNFGIGPLPCAGSYGDACEEDEDCRGTDCGGSIERHGACAGGVCIEQECQSEKSIPREATCIGGFNRD